MRRKLIFCLLIVLALSFVCQAAVKPKNLWRKSLGGNFSMSFSGTSVMRDAVPSGVWTKREGDLWFDITGDEFYIYDGGSWAIKSSSGGTTLDGSYDYGGAGAGRTINATDGAVQITNTENDSASLLGLTYSGTSTGDALTITLSGGSGDGIEFENTGSGSDIEGTGNTWSISKAGAAIFATLAPTGTSTFVDDITYTGANYNMIWDTSADQLELQDNAQISFGTGEDVEISFDATDLVVAFDDLDWNFGSDGAGGDIYIYSEAASSRAVFTEATDDLLLIAYDVDFDDNSNLVIGSDDEFNIDNSSESLRIIPSDTTDDFSVVLGVDTSGLDLKIFGATTATYLEFDASADELLLRKVDLKISQGSQIEFIDVTDGLTDWTIDNATDETLLFYPTEITDDQTVNFGTATNTTDFRLFGATASTVVFDASADEVLFTAYDIGMQDGDLINWGNSDDFTMTGTNQAFTFGTLTSDETSAWNFGADTDGDDVKLFGATTGAYFLWDADADAVLIDKADIAFSESDGLLFGDTLGTGDIRIDAAAAVLTIGQVAAGTGSVVVGVDDAGLDWTFFGDTTLVNMKWTTATGLLAFTGQVNIATFEGTTVNGVDTILAVADPTVGNQVWTLPDLAVADTVAVMASTLATNAPEVANSVTGGTNQLIMEGATGGDGFQTIVTPVDATADRTLTIPNKTGIVLMGSAASVITPSTTPTLTIGLSNIYTDTPTDNENQTITFSAGGTAGDELTIIFTSTGAADEIITFHATLVSTTGTLTIDTTAARYFVIKFVSDGSHWYEVSRTAEQT